MIWKSALLPFVHSTRCTTAPFTLILWIMSSTFFSNRWSYNNWLKKITKCASFERQLLLFCVQLSSGHLHVFTICQGYCTYWIDVIDSFDKSIILFNPIRMTKFLSHKNGIWFKIKWTKSLSIRLCWSHGFLRSPDIPMHGLLTYNWTKLAYISFVL